MTNHNTPHVKAHSHGAKAETKSLYVEKQCRSFNLEDFPIPHAKEENWRFTPLHRINSLFDPKNYTDKIATNIQINAPQEVIIEQETKKDARLGTIGMPNDRISAVAWNAFNKSTIITIPKLQVLNAPIVIDINNTLLEATAQHIFIDAKELSESIVVINHLGSGKLNQTIEINVGDNANLTVVSIQELDDSAIYASHQRINTGKDSNLKHIVVSLGADLSRMSIDVDLKGTGANVDLYGLYFVDANQHIEHRVYTVHTVANCKSRVSYKGALQGDNAHAVWIGDSLIDTYADGTDTYELNRNLVLTKNTKVNSVPNLEIKNGEIEGAGHASATGRFDDQQLFYLMSRGIDADTAKRLVVRGFFAELINNIGIESIQHKLMQAIEEELNQTGN